MKRAWLLLILALIGTVGSATADEVADDRRQPVDVARRYVDAFLAGDMQTLLDHAAPPLKDLMKDAANVAALRARSVGDSAQSADEEISVIYHRRVKSAGGKAFMIMAQVAPDGQLVAFSIQPAGDQKIAPMPGQAVKPEPNDTSDHDADELAIDAKLRRRLVGRYQLAPTFIFTVTDRDGHLMVGITNQETQEVFPDSPTRWSYRGVDAALEFQLPKTGSAKSLILHQNGIEQTARRMK